MGEEEELEEKDDQLEECISDRPTYSENLKSGVGFISYLNRCMTNEDFRLLPEVNARLVCFQWLPGHSSEEVTKM